MGRYSQRKGADGEKELRDILRANGYDVDRGGSQTYGTVPDLYGLPDIHVEVKRNEHLNIHDAIRQAERDAEKFKDGAPTVFHRKNRTGWLVTMPLNSWLNLYRAANGENRRAAAS